MNITIPSSVLDNILTSLQPFLDKKDASQITSHIYLEATNGELICKATDFEIGLKTTTQSLNILEDGIATVNGKQILDVIKRLKEEVNLYTNNDNLHIQQNKNSFKLPMFNAKEFPVFPEHENLTQLEINALELITSFKKIFPVIGIDNQRRELNGALLDIKKSFYNFVSTDSKRLAIIKFDKPSQKDISLIFPRKAITEIQRLFLDDIELFFNEQNVVLKSKNYTFFSQLINGKFPDYEKIAPKEVKQELTIPKSSIIDGIKVINSITTDVKITFRPNEILFESISYNNSEAKTQIEIPLDLDEEIEIAVKSNHILDFLTQIDTATCTWSLNGKNAPFMLKSENFSTVIMPIVI